MFKKVMCLVIACCCIMSGVSFAAELKIGVLDFRKTGNEYDKAKELRKELEVKRDGTQKEIEEMTAEISKLRDELDLLSESAKEKKQAELREKTREYNEFRRTKSEELLYWRDSKMREITKDIIDTATNFAKKNGYDIILDQMAAVYYSEKFDITDTILKELNK
jgi:outer membrane protein